MKVRVSLTFLLKFQRPENVDLTSFAGFPAMVAYDASGNCVEEWLPQMTAFLTSATGTPAFRASWAEARFWSSLEISESLKTTKKDQTITLINFQTLSWPRSSPWGWSARSGSR